MDKLVINFTTQGFPVNSPAGKLLYSYLKEISAAYFLQEQYAYEYFFEHPSGREVFCEWLTERDYLTIKSFHFVVKGEKTIGTGFEIMKDSKLTGALLKLGLTDNDE